MTTALVFDQRSVSHLQMVMKELPRRVQIRQLRIALNAWGSVVKAEAVAQVKKISGLLSRSLRVRVIIPDASRNTGIHGRPARVFVGASRSIVKAQASIAGKFKFLSVRKATKRVLSGGKVRAYKPSRYAHFVEKGIAGKGRTTPNPFTERAQRVGNTIGFDRFKSKLGEGIDTEARAIAFRNN